MIWASFTGSINRWWQHLRFRDKYTDIEVKEIKFYRTQYAASFSPEALAQSRLNFDETKKQPLENKALLEIKIDDLTKPICINADSELATLSYYLRELLLDFMRLWCEKNHYLNSPIMLLSLQLAEWVTSISQKQYNDATVEEISKMRNLLGALYTNGNNMSYPELQTLLFQLKNALDKVISFVKVQVSQSSLNQQLSTLIHSGTNLLLNALSYLFLVLRDVDFTKLSNKFIGIYFNGIGPRTPFYEVLTETLTGKMLLTLALSESMKQLFSTRDARFEEDSQLVAAATKIKTELLALTDMDPKVKTPILPVSPESKDIATNSPIQSSFHNIHRSLFFDTAQESKYTVSPKLLNAIDINIIAISTQQRKRIGMAQGFTEIKNAAENLQRFINIHGLLDVYAHVLYYLKKTCSLLDRGGDFLIQAVLQQQFTFLIKSHRYLIDAIKTNLNELHEFAKRCEEALLTQKKTSDPWYANLMQANNIFYDKGITTALETVQKAAGTIANTMETLQYRNSKLPDEVKEYNQHVNRLATDIPWLVTGAGLNLQTFAPAVFPAASSSSTISSSSASFSSMPSLVTSSNSTVVVEDVTGDGKEMKISVRTQPVTEQTTTLAVPTSTQLAMSASAQPLVADMAKFSRIFNEIRVIDKEKEDYMKRCREIMLKRHTNVSANSSSSSVSVTHPVSSSITVTNIAPPDSVAEASSTENNTVNPS